MHCWHSPADPVYRVEWMGLAVELVKQQIGCFEPGNTTAETRGRLHWWLRWGGRSLRRRVAYSISMHMSLWRPCVNCIGLFVKLLAFYTVYSDRLTLGCFTQVKTFRAFFDPLWVALAAWGLAVIAPSSCLSCAGHSFIATVGKNCSLKYTAAIKGWNNKRGKRKGGNWK